MSSLKAMLLTLTFGLVLAGCSSSTSTSPSTCQLSAAIGQSTMAAAGGAGTITVTAASGCSWTAATNVNWISNISPASGMGNGQVAFQVAANSAPSPRSGQITLNSVN